MSHFVFWFAVLQGIVFLAAGDVLTPPRPDPGLMQEIVNTQADPGHASDGGA